MPAPDDSQVETHPDHSGPSGQVRAYWDGGSATASLPATGTLTFGRAKECEICIDLPSVSRQHARLHVGEPLSIEDLESANGTRVGGERLTPKKRVPIRRGEVVHIGGATIFIEHARRGSTAHAASSSAPASARGGSSMAAAILPDGAMRRIQQQLALIAPSNLSVIVFGETGVGKELAAEMLHQLSRRAQGPFVRLNCAAFPEALLESELFGHEKGAFTGAVATKRGLLESAHNGTVFLDEIAELPLAAQAKLLRALEAREITPLGSVTPRTIDVRFVAATHRDLTARVDEGSFRQDLYFRLKGASVSIPPLRERRGEIPLLSATFAAAVAESMGRPSPEIAPEAAAALDAYEWPGNIRELRNAIERAVVLAGSGPIGVEHLPPEVVDDRPAHATGADTSATAPVLREELEALEVRRIREALEQCAGNQGRAAELLGISRRTLLTRLDAHALPRPRKGQSPAKR